MAFQLQDIDPDVDFPALVRCILAAYEDPPQRFLHIFLPINGHGPEAREAAIHEGSERLKLWHINDPSSYWQKAVDVETGTIIGGASWNIHKANPFAEPSVMNASWFPDDSSRKFVQKALENYGKPRFEAAQKPHLYLFNVFTHPDHRRRGIGQHIMDWGMKTADDLGLEVFLDATPSGKPLYEANGFVCIEENITAPMTDNPDEKWKEIELKVSPFTFWLMWRPVNGRYDKGKSIKPGEACEGSDAKE